MTPPEEKFAVWTHPKESHGQLEFAVIGENTIDPRLQPAWSSAYWNIRHPLGITRASHITVVVGDLSTAKRFYCEVLNATPIHDHEVAGRKRSTYVAVGADTIVELAEPLSPSSPEGQDLEKNGEGVHALTFTTNNLSRATEFLKSKQMRPEPDGNGAIVLGADQAFGMVVGFTEWTLPNDPRVR